MGFGIIGAWRILHQHLCFIVLRLLSNGILIPGNTKPFSLAVFLYNHNYINSKKINWLFMIKKILLILTALILVILPFLVGIPTSKYSPYVEENSFKTYVIIWSVISIVFSLLAIAVLKYYTQSFGSLPIIIYIQRH